MLTVSVVLGRAYYQTRVSAGKHVIIADEPEALGGGDEGMDPFELLLASVGSCTAITLRMYADRKSWPLESIQIDLSLKQKDDKSETCIEKNILFSGDLTREQKERLMRIADKCPTHQVLTHPVHITSILKDEQSHT